MPFIVQSSIFGIISIKNIKICGVQVKNFIKTRLFLKEKQVGRSKK